MTPTEYKALRKSLGTQAHVAGRLGIDRVTVVKREAGKLRIDREAELALGALTMLAERPGKQAKKMDALRLCAMCGKSAVIEGSRGKAYCAKCY